MNILLCGANGFIGRHLTATLTQAGHRVICGVRTINENEKNDRNRILIDYAQDTSAGVWQKRFKQLAAFGAPIDIVINAVGVLNEQTNAPFSALHRDAPIALFDAAAMCNVKGIVQISALRAEHETGIHPDSTPYMRSKREADAHLAQSTCAHLILRPSLIVGVDGDSSRLFRTLASLPVIALPGRGQQQIQPVTINDLCEAVAIWIADQERKSTILNAVGPTAMSYKDMLQTYRDAMHLMPAIYVPIPMFLMRLSAKAAVHLPQKVLSPDTIRMLELGNTADQKPFTSHLGRAPTSSAEWFANIPASMLAAEAISNWTTPLLRIALAIVWLVTGALSMGIYPTADSLKLLAALGLSGTTALVTLYGAATLDMALGIATLFIPSRQLWLLQILLIAGYSAAILFALPEFYLHPFGPILKNVPILAILFLLYSQSEKPNQRGTL
jgi:uncharacterized protein YbjT (DUF2867 family)